MSYDFTTLDPTDFEALVADLFSKSWGSRLESFKTGKDGGIDLRHSRVPSDQPTTIDSRAQKVVRQGTLGHRLQGQSALRSVCYQQQE
jgi:hypothetical protein